jgi:hypothetical protein
MCTYTRDALVKGGMCCSDKLNKANSWLISDSNA